MKNTINKAVSFFLLLSLISCIAFAGHVFVLKQLSKPLFDNLIIQAYLLNLVFASIVYAIILFLSKKHENILGFVFMSSSLIKFGLFFLFFSPTYRADDEMSRIEFLTFFIPYAVCLIIETTFLIKQLNKQTIKA
jgi:hypothetical protein